MKRFVLRVSILATGLVASSNTSVAVNHGKEAANAAQHPCHIHCWNEYWACKPACAGDPDCEAMCEEERTNCLQDCNGYGGLSK